MKYGGELTLRRGSLRSGTPKHGTYPNEDEDPKINWL
jgi:hypothetical protein